MSHISLVDALKNAPPFLTAADASKIRHSLGLIDANGVAAGIDNLHAIGNRHRLAARLDSDPTRRREHQRAADAVDGIITALEVAQ